MWFSRLFKKHKDQDEKQEPAAPKREPINQGIYYLYLIIGLQIVFVFGLLGAIMFIGKVISTPGWVFLLMFMLFIASMVYIYKKAKAQFRRLRESLGRTDLSNRNYEISLMGGMLTMRIEQNPNAPKLLQAPTPPEETIIDAETIEPAEQHRKPAHLS